MFAYQSEENIIMYNSICESCGKSSDVFINKYDIPKYVEEYDSVLCAGCEVKLDNSIEQHEEDKRRKLQEDNEY